MPDGLGTSNIVLLEVLITTPPLLYSNDLFAASAIPVILRIRFSSGQRVSLPTLFPLRRSCPPGPSFTSTSTISVVEVHAFELSTETASLLK